ncbi:MAG: hypothetical protein H6Q05_2148 [Acidobacteria bacterium]|nr:hypothetical protein [Acidobacteriota bacterium]
MALLSRWLRLSRTFWIFDLLPAVLIGYAVPSSGDTDNLVDLTIASVTTGSMRGP